MAEKHKSKGFNAPFSKLKKVAAAKEVAPRPPPVKKASKQTTDDNDAALFLQAVGGAKPLPSTRQKVVGPVVQPRPVPTSDDALALAELEELVAGHGEFRVHESEEMHTGAAPGVNQALLEQLRRGQFAYHMHLDLHGHSRDAAHTMVGRFISKARRDGERCVLIITGRGKSSPGGISVLREALPRWLCRAPIRPHVLAFCTAQAVDGGPGAFYVLLRRSGVKPFGEAIP